MLKENEAIVRVVFLFQDFHQQGGGGTGGLEQSWSLERLPVKSSAVNCPNTFDQDCRANSPE